MTAISTAFRDRLASIERRLRRIESVSVTSTPIEWEPILTASSDPDLGTGYSVWGACLVLPGMCQFWGNITFGSTPTAGSGVYAITGLPVVPLAGRGSYLSGVGRLSDASAPGVLSAWVLVDDTPAIKFRYPAAAPSGTDTQVSASAPWTWAEGDRLEFEGAYPIG